MTVEIASLTGPAVKSVLTDLARLRIEVFRDWPYLYQGTYEYEAEYLANFAGSEGAVVVVARDGGAIVGAATALPMTGGHAEELAAPLADAGYDLARVFYLGESVLLRAYRGRGIGHAFFDGREAQARALGGFTHAVFCAVVRPETHPLKPASYSSLDGFWQKRGYVPLLGVVGSLAWRDTGEAAETAKPMQYWMKPL
jgi:GNAT superfamily N-acetyltransferase